jgi:hypothetical protein
VALVFFPVHDTKVFDDRFGIAGDLPVLGRSLGIDADRALADGQLCVGAQEVIQLRNIHIEQFGLGREGRILV